MHVFLTFKGLLLLSEGVFFQVQRGVNRAGRERDAQKQLSPANSHSSTLSLTTVHKPLPTLPPIASISTQVHLPHQQTSPDKP